MTHLSAPATSAASSPKIAPMHDPARSAVVSQPKPLGATHPNQVVPGQTVDPSVPGASLSQKALLAKKFAEQNKPTFSPTDAIQSPCTAKLNSAKQRRFAKATTSVAARLATLGDENADIQR